jgi:hypothetical protein
MNLRLPSFFRSLSYRQANMRRFWWLCAALLSLSVGSLAQDLLHTFFLRGRISVPYDFSAYYLAGKLAREGQLLYYFPSITPPKSFLHLRIDGTTPYGRASDSKGLANPPVLLPYVTPPFVALLMEPFSSVPWEVAYSAWRVVIALACFVAVFFSIRIAAVEKRFHFVGFAVCVGVFSAFFPFKAQIALGQIDCVILLTWTLGTWLFLKHRPVASSPTSPLISLFWPLPRGKAFGLNAGLRWVQNSDEILKYFP